METITTAPTPLIPPMRKGEMYADRFPILAEVKAAEDAAQRPRLLSLAEAAEVVPLSEKQLRRVATRKPEPGIPASPFLKVEGRWMAYEDDLHEWVRASAEASAKPTPAPPRRRRPAKRPAGGPLAAVLAEDAV